MSDPSDALARFIRWVMRDTTYRKVYAATVVGDRGDTVDITPDDEEMRGSRGLSSVRKGSGLLGDKCVVEQGLRCVFGFEDADPRRPIVLAWEYKKGTATVLLDGGGAPVARVGDYVKVLTEPAMMVVGNASGTQTVPNPSGTPPFVDVPIPPPGPVPVAPLILATATISIPVDGVISDGAARVKA